MAALNRDKFQCRIYDKIFLAEDIKTKRRNKQVVYPRQIAMYLSRELTDLSLPEIGEIFGGKDHTTVLHSYNKIKEELLRNAELKERVEKLMQVIRQ